MSQFLNNLRWLPRLIWLALANRVGVRKLDNGLFVYVDSRAIATRKNGITRIEITGERLTR